jgi:nucleoside-diphosphate-sugar epimerase
VYVSTIEVYEPVKGPLTERSARYSGKSMYAAAKLEAERLALAEGLRLGLEVSVIQPAVVYGPYGAAWTVRPLREMATGQVVLVDGGIGACNAVYIDDVVAALLLAATRREAIGEAFLISAAKPVTWANFYGAYEGMLGRQTLVSVSAEEVRSQQGGHGKVGTLTYLARLWRDDPNFRRELRNTSTVQTLYKVGRQILPSERWQRIRSQVGVSDIAPPPVKVNGHTAVASTIHWPSSAIIDLMLRQTQVDISKARHLLGYQPYYSLAEGMELTAAWARWSGLVPSGWQ